MLRNRYTTTVTSNRALMADNSSLSSSKPQNLRNHVSAFLGSPRFLSGFLQNGLSISDNNLVSPSGIFDNKQYSIFANSMFQDVLSEEDANKKENINSKGVVGLASVDFLNDEKTDDPKLRNRIILFGSNLKIQIPQLQPSSVSSPTDFGIKTRTSQTFTSPSGMQPFNPELKTDVSNLPKASPTPNLMTLSEMELSEEYTCVIFRGLNPRTTHIYDNCVVKSF